VGAIVARSFVPGTRAELAVRGEFLPLVQAEASRRLFELYVAAASGFSVAGEFAGGCANSGFAAGVRAPVVCAVGPVGPGVYRGGDLAAGDAGAAGAGLRARF
jgi:glutamate carboxypeptidase